MNRFHGLVAVLALAGSALGQEKSSPLSFAKADLGKAPAGWTVAKTGTGIGSVWKVVEDASAPSKTGVALMQTAEGPGPLFNLCVRDDSQAKDLELSVAFKAVKGDRDQGGGLCWRYQDSNNYYVARYNPLEDNLRLYHLVNGKRTQLKTKEEIRLAAGAWHTLSITMVGDKIECSLNGVKYIEATDAAITKSGKFGVWTKADAQTAFDRIEIKDLGRRE